MEQLRWRITNIDKPSKACLLYALLVTLVLIVSACAIVLVTTLINKEDPELIGYYESDIDDMSIDYDDDNDCYDVFIEEEQRHIFIKREHTEIVISDDYEVIVCDYEGDQYDEIIFMISPYQNDNE